MPYLSCLLLLLLFYGCAADVTPEDIPENQAYAFAGTGDLGAPDTLPLPTAAANDTVAHGGALDAPTPYGMRIEDEPYAASKGVAAQSLLTGEWVNVLDDDEHVELTATHYKTFYQGELLVEEDMTFHGLCPEACSGGVATGKPCFTISGPAQTDCYGIVRLTDDELELQLLGVSNETVVYRRAD